MTHIVRRVLFNEYEKYRTHLKALDAESRHLRFGFTVKDEILDKLCDGFEADHEHHILFCIENDALEFIAVGHIATTDGMELAFSVLKEHQGKGMGDALMKRCIQWCRTHNILKGCMVCLSHNKAIRHLCTKHGIHFHTEHGETEANIELDAPGIDTFINEGMDSNFAVLDYMGKRNRLPWIFTP
jgi:GNAT superfamily N-acetyltransferase